MKRILYAATGILLLVSCRKDIGLFSSENPLTSKDYQVAEYHKSDFDQILDDGTYSHKIWPFRKKYDPSGKTVVEIDGAYDYPTGGFAYSTFAYREMAVIQKGRMVYLVDKINKKNGGPDTLLRITLNAKGRPESSVADSTWLPVEAAGAYNINQTYIYKDNRVVAVHHFYTRPGVMTTGTDSLIYDQYGDLLSFNGNTYEYDYTHPIKQQFVCEAWQNHQEGFYYLQFLGYFPEVNSPAYAMTKWTNDEGPVGMGNQILDSRGRLISYDYSPSGFTQPPTTITWK